MTQFNAPTYHIDRPSGQCVFTGRQLQPGEPYVAALVEIDPQDTDKDPKRPLSVPPQPVTAAAVLGFRRLDISIEAWNQGQRPERMFSFWRSTVPQPNQKRKLFVDDQVLLDIFRRLTDALEPERQAFRFVLGLILTQKRMLKFDGIVRRQVGEVQQEWWRVIPRAAPGTGVPGSGGYEADSIEVLNPQIDDEKVKQVTAQLSEILEAEL